MPVIIAHHDECDIAKHGPTVEHTAMGLNAEGDDFVDHRWTDSR